MAKNSTFDVTSTIDMQEVDNAVNQATKEIGQRYDFKGGTHENGFRSGIVKAIKNGGFKKVQAQIQDDQVRVQSPSIDELQAVIALLKKEDFGLELQFGNFRS